MNTVWIQVDKAAFDRMGRKYIHDLIAKAQRELADPKLAAYRAAADTEEGEPEVDPDAVVSVSDGGAYVMSWQWITDEEANE